jgi:hypothetical protein
MTLPSRYQITCAVVVIALAVLYFLTAPVSVQTGDTGELVTNAYYLRVSHPPGYPLYTLLYHLPTRILGPGNPFQAAALFTAMLSVLWIGLLAFRTRSYDALVLLGALATSLLFWRYSVLPDVFSLHLLFLVLVFLAFQEPQLLERPWMIFLISLGVANHHTIVFAFPLFLFALARLGWRRKLLQCLIFGLLSGSLYFTLLLFDTNHPGSWGHMEDLTSVVRHFLRSEYGTFQLANRLAEKADWPAMLGDALIMDHWALFLLWAFLLVRHRATIAANGLRLVVLGLSLLAYMIVFLAAGRINLSLRGESVFERFLLHPTLFLYFLAFSVLYRGQVVLPIWLRLLVLANIVLNLNTNFKFNDYSENFAIEDYTINSLKTVSPGAVYFAMGDTEGFATYYVQQFKPVRDDIIVLLPTYVNAWSADKFQQLYPDAIIAKSGHILQTINLDKYALYTNADLTTKNKPIQKSYKDLLFKYTKTDEPLPGMLMNCDGLDQLQRRTQLRVELFARFEYSLFHEIRYGQCHYWMGLDQLARHAYDAAKRSFAASVELTPFAGRHLERLCHVMKLTKDPAYTQCETRLDELLENTSRQYYLFKY